MARSKQSWSNEDLSLPRKFAGTKLIAATAKELGRTTGTVLAKAVEHRLPAVHRIERSAS